MTNLFAKLEGQEIRIGNSPVLRRFRVGEYNNGRPFLALDAQVTEPDRAIWWEPDIILTVNLPDVGLPEGAFFVRAYGYEKYLEDMLGTGLFQDMGVWIPAGYVEKYARVWRLA